MLLVIPGQALAASLTVTRTDDPTSGTCGASSCSLRQAINLADTDGSSDVINIPAGTYQLSDAAGGALPISASMTLQGASARSTTVLPAAGDEAIAISGGDVAINGLMFANSTATTDGGAIGASGSGTLALNNDIFSNNGVAGINDGGAIEEDESGQLTINASTFSGNKGYNGGALDGDAPARIVNSTFVGNMGGTTSANGDSGAIELVSGTLINDTITGNECFNGSGCGGGLSFGALSIADTIIAGNLAYDPGTQTTSTDNCSSTITVTGPDLTDGSDCTGFTVHGDPQLGPLQDNGGPTDTQLPAAASPAIDAGADSTCAASDQRGVPRPQGAHCDIGAVERTTPTAGTPSLSNLTTTGASLSATANPGFLGGRYLYSYGTTTAYGHATTTMPLQASVGPQPAPAALSGLTPGTTYHLQLVVTSPDGSASSQDVTFTTKPAISSLAVSPRSFSLAGRKLGSHCVKPTKKNDGNKHCRRAIKLIISYKLSGAATVTFMLARKATGRKVNGKCLAPTKKNKRKTKCTRLINVHGKLVKTGNAGGHRFLWNGKIGGHKLAPSTYQLTATPAGGRPETVTFKIVGRG